MTTNVRKLLDEIRQSRESVENDQRDCHNAIQQLHAVKKNVQNATKRMSAICNEQKEADEYHAAQSAELSYVNIQDKVVAQALVNVNKELSKARHDLRKAKKDELDVSRNYLQEAVEFGGMWNCSEIGEKSRHDATVKQRDEMKHRKHSLEYDLREFLARVNHLKEAEKERDDLEKQYLNQEGLAKSKEDEAYQLLRETEEVLEQLQKQHSKVMKQCEDEEKRLQRKVAQSQQSVLFWERRVSETQKNLEEQVSSNSNPKDHKSSSRQQNNSTTSCNSVGIACNANRTSNSCTDNSSNYMSNRGSNSSELGSACKYPRITPEVRSNVVPHSAGKSIVPASTTTSKTFQLPAKNTTNFSNSSSTFTAPKPLAKTNYKPPPNATYTRNPPITNSTPSISRFFHSVPATTSISNTRNQPSSSISAGPGPGPQPRSNPTSNRVFQFKKKSPTNTNVNSIRNDTNSETVITGPTSRSVPVTLGTTPFSTFQSGRQLLNPQSQNNNMPFNHR